jgi:hypothetical protein
LDINYSYVILDNIFEEFSKFEKFKESNISSLKEFNSFSDDLQSPQIHFINENSEILTPEKLLDQTDTFSFSTQMEERMNSKKSEINLVNSQSSIVYLLEYQINEKKVQDAFHVCDLGVIHIQHQKMERMLT